MFSTIESLQPGDVFDGRYKLLRPLSTDGATADVWLALDTNTIDTEYGEDDNEIHEKGEDSGMLVAIKIYRPKNALDIEGEQRFRDEFKIAYDCHHANLLQPTSFSIFNGIPYLVLPFCKLGSSEQLIGKTLTSDELWKFILDVSSGLERLHSNQPQIIHQDIKPANILIDNSHNYTITDFGISSQSERTHKGYYDDENSGTLAYMAPERFEKGQSPTPASDIWAFGATLCEVFTGVVPYGENGGQSQLEGAPMTSLSGLPSSIKQLIQACLQKDPKKRPTASEIAMAARAKQFPIKRKSGVFILILFILLIAIGAIYYFMSPKDILPERKPTAEELFGTALLQLNDNDSTTARTGLHVMDSLSRCQYVPAMYEMAFTCGWFTDSLSQHRKKILGIKTDNYGFPTSIIDRTNTKNQFDIILELSDSTYADINSKAAYSLAMYYGDKRLSTEIHYQEINKYLDLSEKWATLANDKDLLEKIATTRSVIEKQQKQKKELEQQPRKQVITHSLP